MAKVKGKPRGSAEHLKKTQFKKGQSGNPLGAAHPNHDPIPKKLKKLTSDEVHEVVTLLLESNHVELVKLSKSKTAPALRRWIAGVAVEAMKNNSFGTLDSILNRAIGPVAQRHEHTGANGGPLDTTTTYMSVEERRKAIDELRRAREAEGNE